MARGAKRPFLTDSSDSFALRFGVEFTREPDSFLGLLAAGLSMGQWLSAPMIVAGAAMMVWAHRASAR